MLARMTTTLISGANRGLGYETARRLREAGHDVWMSSRDPSRGRAAAEALGARFVALDVTDDASVAAAVRRVETETGLDVLVNNAGIGAFASVADMEPAEFRRVVETNLVGVFNFCHAAIPAMRRAGGGYIVNISSLAGTNAFAGRRASGTRTDSPVRAPTTISLQPVAASIPGIASTG